MLTAPRRGLNLTGNAALVRSRWQGVLTVALCAAALAVSVPDGPARIALLSAAGVLCGFLVLSVTLGRRSDAHENYEGGAIDVLIADDPLPSFVTDENGAIVSVNPAAQLRFEGRVGETLSQTLLEVCADPAPALSRIRIALSERGNAREDLETRKGTVRISVHRAGRGRLIWRLEDVSGDAVEGQGAQPQGA